MKKLHITLLLALLTGCDNSDNAQGSYSQELEANRVISFDTSISAVTKATIVSSAADMTSVGIYCAHTGYYYSWSTEVDFDKMYNTRLDYNSLTKQWEYSEGDITWGYETLQDRYSFFGYAPFGTSSNGVTPSIDDGELRVEFDTPADAANHPNLLFAEPRKDIYPQVRGSVYLTMKHALACIDFQACGASSAQVTMIELSGFNTKGDVSYDYTNNSIEWSNVGSGTNSSVITTGFNSHTLNSETYTPIVANSGYMMMIPQSIPANAKIIITYNMGDSSYPLTKEFDMAASSVSEWSAANIYTYNFNLTE